MPRTGEVRLAGPRISGDDIEDLVAIAFDGVLYGIVKKRGDVRDLLGREWKARHALVGTAPENDRADRVTILVVQDHHGAEQVRSFLSALCAGAVAETASSHEDRFASFHGSGVVFRGRAIAFVGGGLAHDG